MEKQESIDAWFALVPEQAKATARRLLLEVGNLRREEVIYPPQGDILNALAYVAPEDVRAVILGQDPYHGPGQAMGLSFSVPKGEKLPPSLRNIYKEMASDLGCSIPVSGDLSAWAQQGVLLLNTTLTVREHEANSHSKLGWQVVTTAIVEACMRLPQPVVFLAWGRPAIKLIESAKESVPEILLLTPYYMEPNAADAMRARMDEYGAIVKRLAKEYSLQPVFSEYLANRHSAYLMWDRVHPGPVGSMLIAGKILKEFGFDKNITE